MKTGVDLIADERKEQKLREGFSDSHDDEHRLDEIAIAAACYALPKHCRVILGEVPRLWPWYASDWKPTPRHRVRELVKAGALIAAEIDRLQRLGGGK